MFLIQPLAATHNKDVLFHSFMYLFVHHSVFFRDLLRIVQILRIVTWLLCRWADEVQVGQSVAAWRHGC